jgi:glutathione synthase/RimK-type ligase-like ATP-grasp enzyme
MFMPDTSFLLPSKRPAIGLPPESRDFVAAMSAIFGARIAGLTASCPLAIFTRKADAEADAVGLGLAQRGVAYVRVDADVAQSEAIVAASVDGDNWRLRTEAASTEDRPILWFRHFEATAIGQQPGDPVLRMYAREQWGTFIIALSQLARTRSINPPHITSKLNRIMQLAIADRIGMRRPRSLVTNDLDRVAEYAEACENGVIIKPLGDHFLEPSPGYLVSLFPRRIGLNQVARAHATRSREPAPVLVQEFIPASREMRVHVVGREVIVFAIHKSAPEDIWIRPNDVTVSAADLPAPVQRQILAYVRAAGLHIAAFDFLLTDSGPPVFLEVNVSGDWRFFEQRAGCTSVTDATVAYLAQAVRTGCV